jgi:hypothetical protein
LRPNGIFLIDYFNAVKVGKMVQAQPEGHIDSGAVQFHWRKSIEEGSVVKEITVTDGDRTFNFCEHVQLFTLKEFAEMLQEKFEIVSMFGDYNLANFDEQNSDRLILSCRKK